MPTTEEVMKDHKYPCTVENCRWRKPWIVDRRPGFYAPDIGLCYFGPLVDGYYDFDGSRAIIVKCLSCIHFEPMDNFEEVT